MFTQEQTEEAKKQVSEVMNNLDRIFPVLVPGQLSPTPEMHVRVVADIIHERLKRVFLPPVEAPK